MTRHAKNNTASACYTYHERKRDTLKSGYGTIKERLAKDSIGDFDACCLTLQPCRNPVITPDGYIFDKEAILEYIIHKKAENARKLKQYEREKRKEQEELAQVAAAEEESRAEKFENFERSLVVHNGSSTETPKPGPSRDKASEEKSVSNMKEGRDKILPSFWVPSMTPQSDKKPELKLPDQTVYCPMSGKPLRAKDLLPIVLTPIDKNLSREELITREERYRCPITGDILGNSVPCAVLRPSGQVITMDCVEKIIRKDMIDPLTSTRLKEKDIIPLRRGGTGYASTNVLEAKTSKPVMQV